MILSRSERRWSAPAIGTAALRFTLGAYFIAHVTIRLTIISWPVAIAFFQSLGLPLAVGYIVTLSEALVGLCLILGWQVRVAALAGAVILIGATVLVHFPNGFLFTNAGGGWEYPVFWAIVLICQSLLGPGAWPLVVRRASSQPPTHI